MVAQQWLDLICQMLPKANRGILVCDFSPGSGNMPVACWPDQAIEYTDLSGAAALAAGRNAPVVSSLGTAAGANQPADMVSAFPLKVDGQLFGVVAIQMDAGAEHQAIVNQLLEWGQAWLNLLLQPQSGQQQQTDVSLGVLAAGFSHPDIPAAAAAVATSLKQEYACQQATLGLLEDKRIRVQGISDHTKFDSRVSSIRAIETAMQDVVTSGASIRVPAPAAEGAEPGDALATLVAATGRDHACAVPLLDQQELIGVMLLERAGGNAFSGDELRRLEGLGKLLGAQFALKRHQQRSLPAAALEAVLEPLRRLVRPGYFKSKLVFGVLALSVLVLAFAEGEYRISAPAGLEGKIQRAIVAPFEGYIAKAHARAGETVVAGEVIAELEDRELKLELQRWLSQRDEMKKHYRGALAGLDHAQARIYKAQVAQAQAQLELIDQKLQRAQLPAPIDGIIISGDLSRSLGSPVERGEVLFEVAPLEEYRVVLQVNENKIRDIKAGQRGWLSLTALSNQKIQFEVERVATVFEQQDGKVSYRTEARIIDAIDSLRPGMQGIGKIVIEPRRYGWILFHSLFDWLRIQMWSWLP